MSILDQSIQLLKQVVQNLEQLSGKIELAVPKQLFQVPSTEDCNEEVPYQVDEPSEHLGKEECLECIERTMQQFRQWRAIECDKAQNLEEVLSIHSQNYYRTLRQQIYKFIVITEGFKYTRGMAKEKMAHCPFCRFENLLTYVTAHVLKKHANNYQIYSCAVCNKDFQSHRLLIIHIHNYHRYGVEKPRRKYTRQSKRENENENEDEDDEIYEDQESPEISI